MYDSSVAASLSERHAPDMQLESNLAVTDVTAAPIRTRSSAHSLALISRIISIPIAFASILALSIEGALSVALYALAQLLKKIPPLRPLYQFFSSTYDRFIDRLAQVVLRDPRDAPALRLMVSLTFTTVPIFIAQLLLGQPRLWLVILFYLSLCGPKFQRTVRMFSTKHLEAHRPHSYFCSPYDKVLGRYAEYFLGFFYGDLPELGRTVHVRIHHKENGGLDDTVATSVYDRTSRLHFLYYLADNFWTTLGIVPCAYFYAHKDGRNLRRMIGGMILYFLYASAVFFYNWRIGIFYVLIPLLTMNLVMSITSWVQHAFCDPEHPDDYLINTVTVLDRVNFMNEGYHLSHHHRSGLHWTEMPAHHERIRDKMRESGSLVFEDLDFMDLFIELTLLRRLHVLADKLVPWTPMSHDERVALLALRTKPVSTLPA